jgi:hypothetical protein
MANWNRHRIFSPKDSNRKYVSYIYMLFILFIPFLGTNPPSPTSPPKQQQSQTQKALPAITHEHVINLPSTNKATIPKRIRPPTHVNTNQWNTSIHVKPNPYVCDLADAYPRDPFTKMPPKRDAVEVYHLLQSIYYIHRK